MKKNLIKICASIVCSLSVITWSARASFAAAPSGFVETHTADDLSSSIYAYPYPYSNYVDAAVAARKYTVPGLKYLQASFEPVRYNENTYYVAILSDVYDNAASLDLMMETWMRENVPGIVPEGVGAREAMYLLDAWIQQNFTYKKSQYDYRILLNEHTGNCDSLSVLFASAVNYIPFDPTTGLVAYTAANPVYLDMKVIGDPVRKHGYNAIKLNGKWLYTDVTADLHYDKPTVFLLDKDTFFSRVVISDGDYTMNTYCDLNQIYPE